MSFHYKANEALNLRFDQTKSDFFGGGFLFDTPLRTKNPTS